ncbi:MAG: TonB-dependent receptor [Myxococcales bacterium]|nr:MAG: TonB-dependent receptor [Myxococcales bacterium]
MRPFRLAPALISFLVLNGSFAASAFAQEPPKPPEAEEGADAEEAPMDDAEPAPPPAAGDKPAAAAPPPAAAEAEAEEVPADEEMPSDAEMEAEMNQELAAEDAAGAAALTKPPAKGKGAIVGVVKDAVEHETTPEAQITVVGTKYKTIADFDGRYRLELPPGTYTLRIYVELHKPSVVKGVEVKADTLDRFDIDVVPDESSVDTVEIVTEADKSSVEGLLLTRQRSASVGDGVGRSEISKTPAGNAAQAAQRVVGATIVGNRFVYVRGLGERYTNALLNGTPLPSPEPDRAAIPLDLFPSLILENINIVKTFTPDMPADFAGGSVRIETRELPSKPLFQLSMSMGIDTNSTFRDRLAQRGSNTDWLGYDSGLRGYPKGFPSYVLAKGPKPGGGMVTDDDVLSAARQLNSSMHPLVKNTAPNYSLGVVAGRGWSFGDGQRIGALASLNYGRSFQAVETHIAQYQPDVIVNPDGSRTRTVSPTLLVDGKRGIDKVTWGSLGSVSYWPTQDHRFTLLGMHTQLADATAQVLQGIYASRGAQVATTNLRYVSRALNVLQLRGEDDFRKLNRAELRWYASYSVAARDEPNTRDTAYQFNADTVSWNSISTPENGSHFFAKQTEKTKGAGLDWSQPLLTDPEDLKLKVGGLLSSKDRDFAGRRFSFGKVRGAPNDAFFCSGAEYDINCPVDLYQYGNVGTILALTENTKPEDAYTAKQNIYAGYAMLDALPLKDLRVVGGVRVEKTKQDMNPYSQFAGGMAPPGAKIDSTDWLPALSLTYSATKKTKMRAAMSRTLARPQTRELAPFVFADFFGSYPIAGNPQLKLTYIQNIDLRFEAFPTPAEVLAFSIFAKSFDDPIEPYVFPSGTPGLISYQNAKGAKLIGLELEGRKNLSFLHENLKPFSVITNLTLTHSRIELDPNQTLQNSTNRSRAMVNQAPYVINVALDYAGEELGLDARLLYNVVGKRIVQVGTGGLDDTYAQPQHTVDATVSKKLGKNFQVKFLAANILNVKWRETVGKTYRDDRVTREETLPRVFTLQAAYTY